MTPRLFTTGELAAGAVIQLDSASAHHTVRVLRLGIGAGVELFDGKGSAAHAAILRTDPCTVQVSALLPPLAPPTLRLTLAQCISAADKMDWTIEKAVELGVDAIVAIQSQKTMVKLSAQRSARRREHWQRLIVAAAAQSGQNRLPRFDGVIGFNDWLRLPPAAPGIGPKDGSSLRLILDPRAQDSLAAVLAAREPGHTRELQLLCGPESGFSDNELAAACSAGWLPAGLGPRVLRTETAGLAALAIIQARWGDLR
jgi:16S rRNA (uracil1498-N3)-methyltransferase